MHGAVSGAARPRSYGRACAAVDSVLHCAVRAELKTFLGELRDNGRAPLPRYVVQALRAYLRCGDFTHGFSRYHCDRCHHDLLVAFSCGKRSICPSCGVRRMDEVGAELGRAQTDAEGDATAFALSSPKPFDPCHRRRRRKFNSETLTRSGSPAPPSSLR